MNPSALQEELKALHPGRGIRRPEIRAWLGPELLSVLALDDRVSEAQIRSALVALLRRHAAHLPEDLERLFLMGTGVSLDGPSLNDRLLVGEDVFDRSTRVLRRRLRDAEQILADRIAQERDDRTGPPKDGWQWVGHDMRLAFEGDLATLTLVRTLEVLSEGPKRVDEVFHLAGELELPPGAVPMVWAEEGFEHLQVAHGDPHMLEVSASLPSGLMPGDLLDTRLVVRIPEKRALLPILALVPTRPVRRLSMKVDFGDPPVADVAWVVEAVVPSSRTFERPFDALAVSRGQVVRASFVHPMIGRAYGVCWHWAD